MKRLKISVDPTDILEHYNAVAELITNSPLTKGNKATLLADECLFDPRRPDTGCLH